MRDLTAPQQQQYYKKILYQENDRDQARYFVGFLTPIILYHKT